MVLWHTAYTFDSDVFHDSLREKIVKRSQLDLTILQSLAKAAVEHASGDFMRVLSHFRYDPEWLDDLDGDGSQAYLWYVLNLAIFFQSCPSLSNNRFRDSSLVLEAVLPAAAWSNDDVLSLVHGRRLDALLKREEDQIFVDAFTLYGGCLSVSDVRLCLDHFKASARYFLPESDVSLKAIEAYSRNSEIPPDELLRMAYSDTVDMLQTAIQRDQSLYLMRAA